MDNTAEPEPTTHGARLRQALFQHALDAVLIADDDRCYVDVNPAACELIGIDRDSLIGRRVEDFFEMVATQDVPDAWKSFQQEGTQTGVCLVRRPDGSSRYASFRAKANFLPGLHLSILQDVTELRAAEHELAISNKQLRTAIADLQRSKEELSYFAHTVAHDRAHPSDKWSLLAIALLAVVGAVYAGVMYHRVYYGRNVYDTMPPQLPQQLSHPAILVFSKTNGFRDDDAIRAANAALAGIANKRGWSAFFTENGAVFNPADLNRFAATVWNNTSGDVLTPEQKRAFRSYIENGGGFVGIHRAGGDPRYEWRWYVETSIGAEFKGHPLNPQFQSAVIHIEDPNDVTVRGLPREWSRVDEWYSFEKSPRGEGVKVLATLDERTYRPKMFWKDISMGADHPIIWKHCVGKGRAFYSALGHSATTYQEPLHRKELEGAIAWAAGLTGDGCSQ